MHRGAPYQNSEYTRGSLRFAQLHGSLRSPAAADMLRSAPHVLALDYRSQLHEWSGTNSICERNHLTASASVGARREEHGVMSLCCPNCGHEITDADIDEQARRLAIRACGWCQGDGWRIDPANRHRGPVMPGIRCDHRAWSADEIAQATS